MSESKEQALAVFQSISRAVARKRLTVPELLDDVETRIAGFERAYPIGDRTRIQQEGIDGAREALALVIDRRCNGQDVALEMFALGWALGDITSRRVLDDKRLKDRNQRNRRKKADPETVRAAADVYRAQHDGSEYGMTKALAREFGVRSRTINTYLNAEIK